MTRPSNNGSRRPSIYDVAKRAGVSHMSVSRVLNDQPNISEATRTRVMKAIEELNFTRNWKAHALATRHARRIGAAIGGTAQNGPNSTLLALETAARRVGYAVSVSSIGDDDASQVDGGVTQLLAQGVDALCIIAPRESSLQTLRQRRIGPTVVVEAGADPSWHTVGVDQRWGARLAVRHLIDLGHRRIAHLAGPPDRWDARERAQGWRDCLAEAGLSQGPYLVGDWTSDRGYDVGRSLDLENATAVFAANDQMALGVIHGLHGRGIRVPQDVSVVGFDDLSNARHFLPPLTTVRQDFTRLGELALMSLMDVIENDTAPSHRTLQPDLTVRQSTGASRERTAQETVRRVPA